MFNFIQIYNNNSLFFTIIIMKKHSSTLIASVIQQLRAGIPHRDIAVSTGIGLGSITKIRSEHCPDLPKSSGGRPSTLSLNDASYAVNLMKRGRAKNAVQAAKALSDITNRPVHPQVVRNHLKQAGAKAGKKKKKPKLNKEQIKKRLDFAERTINYTVEDWKCHIFSDETKINCFGSDGMDWVWSWPGEGLSEKNVQGTVKFGGGNIMIWGCMTWDGVGFMCRIEGRMDGDLYVQIMEDELLATLDHYGLNAQKIIFQQDNDPKHTCGKAKKWFKDHQIEVLRWPPQSPDINPIEHLWVDLKKILQEYEEPPKGILELWERVQVAWEKITPEMCQRLIESMPRRVAAVLKAKGGYTKY